MKSKQSGFSLPKFVYHLGHLSRERIDITALSLGGSIARGTAKIVFWVLIASFSSPLPCAEYRSGLYARHMEWRIPCDRLPLSGSWLCRAYLADSAPAPLDHQDRT